MTRWYHAVLFAILLCLLLITDVARATVGGPSAVEVLGWDPVARKIYVVTHHEDAARWDRPVLAYYLLDAEDPSVLVVDHAFHERTQGEPGPDRTSDRIDALRARLEPLVPVEPLGLEIRERLLAVEGCAGLPDPFFLAPCREVLVQLHWQGQVRQLQLTTWGMSDLVGAWEVADTGHRLVLYTHLGHTHEMGYQQEISLLFEPDHGLADRPTETPTEELARREMTDSRHF
jgi:hypothetical protein